MRSVHTAWAGGGAVYEKYSCQHAGQAGDGGEYNVQEGFGWTNGVTLSLLASYPDISTSSAAWSAPTSVMMTLLSVVTSRL